MLNLEVLDQSKDVEMKALMEHGINWQGVTGRRRSTLELQHNQELHLLMPQCAR